MRIAAALLVCAILFGLVRVMLLLRDPAAAILTREAGAHWILFDSPVELKAQEPATLVSLFRTRFAIAEQPSAMQGSSLWIRSFSSGGAWLNGQGLLEPTDPADWKSRRNVDLAPMLRAGENELIVQVANQNAPPAAMVYSHELNIFSGPGWEASVDGQNWSPVRVADDFRQPELVQSFEPAERALLRSTPLLLASFVLVLLLYIAYARSGTASTLRAQVDRWLVPATVRWVLILLWIVLAANNIWKIPADVGFDVQAHLAYMLFIHHYGKLPLATDGWQMFEAPLYYILSLPFVSLSLGSLDLDGITKLLRIIPLLCAIAQIELCYRSLRLAFPQRKDLQMIGTVAAGLMPMLLYRSQTIGSEPMVGALSSAAIYLSLLYVYGSISLRSKLRLFAIGVALGLALLTKVTAILLVPILIGWVASMSWMRAEPTQAILQRAGLIIAIALLICGWYFARNWIELGTPFVGGWDQSRQFQWWQEPGYRTPVEMVRFGQSLRFPIYSSITSFWDGMYSTMWLDGALSGMARFDSRPPWRDHFMLSGALLGIVPTIALIIGGVRSAQGRRHAFVRPGVLMLAAACVLIYVAAVGYLYLTVPIHSIAKASYTLGVLPAYAILIAAGFEALLRTRWLRPAVIALFVMWAVAAYLAYFV